METKTKNIVLTCIMASFFLALSLLCLFKPEGEYSESERRVLKSFPQISPESVVSGKFMAEFEEYTVDRFPMRDSFRTLKAVSSLYVFQNMDNNGIYLSDGYISKLEYPKNEAMLTHASECFEKIYDSYLSENDVKVYFSIVPDKNYFLAEQSGHLSIDYDNLIESMRGRLDFMEYIDITDLLSIEDYYKTDTHWRQEKIVDVAQRLGEKMGVSVDDNYQTNTLDVPFYGVYCGQSALPVKPDTIQYLTNETIDSCLVTSYDKGIPVPKSMYDMEKAHGKDPYEIFTSGASPIITIENPNCETERELVIFRDSFGSSLAPLLTGGYSKITMVDTRYIRSDMLGNFIGFDDRDVLFIYSTILLNNSLALK